MRQQNRPRIGITMRIELETERFYLARYYSEAVEGAGGTPVHIPLIPKAEFIQHAVEDLDGILLPGSDSDVDPLRYGREPRPQIGGVHPIKDETDLLVLAEIEARAMPLFAICFGVQILNVFRGGTLIQDIASQHPKLGWERDELSQALFERFVLEAGRFAGSRSDSAREMIA